MNICRSSGPGGKRFEDKIVDTLKKYVNEGAYLSKKWLKKHFAYSFSKKKKTLCLFNHLPHLHTCKYLSNLIASPKVLLIDDVTMPTQDTKPGISSSCLCIPESSYPSTNDTSIKLNLNRHT